MLGVRLPLGRGIAGWVVTSGQAIAVSDVHRDQRFDAETAASTGYVPTRSWPCRSRTTTARSGCSRCSIATSDDARSADRGRRRPAGRLWRSSSPAAAPRSTRCSPIPQLAALLALVRRLGDADEQRPHPGHSLAARGPRPSQGRLVTLSLPAWSDAFDPDRLRPIHRCGWSGPISRRWAWGDGSGAGVPGGGDRQRHRRRPPAGRRRGGRGRDRAGRTAGRRRTGHRGPPRRPLRPRHGVRGDHPRPGAGVRAVQRAGPRRLTVGGGRSSPPGCAGPSSTG